MIEKLSAFALVFGLSSLAFAGSPRAGTRATQAGPPARASKAKPARASARTHHVHDDRVRNIRLALRKADAQADGPVHVYVNGSGALLRGGFEDAANARSSIVGFSDLSSVELPAYAGGSWPQMMSCVREQFSGFDIELSDQRPSSDDFIMIMVGGSPGDIGESAGVAGVAPYMGSVIRGAVGFAFSEVHGGDTRGLCETVAHEIGHTLGLDHAYECSDTMSYLSCGPKQFQDQVMSCGEWEPRTCASGGASQNSHAQLASSLGLRPATDPLPVPEVPELAPEPEPADDGWWDAAGDEQWEDWVVWDPDTQQWYEWDATLAEWVVWAGFDAGDEWDEWDAWDEEEEWGCPNS